MKLAFNFTLEEFTKDALALRMGIDNTPNQEQIDNMEALCINVLQPLREHLGPMYIVSGFRSPELNKALQGREDSPHLSGMAADIEVPGIPTFDLADWITEKLIFDQVVVEQYTPGVLDSGWVEVSFNPNGRQHNRRQAFTRVRNADGTTEMREGLIR